MNQKEQCIGYLKYSGASIKDGLFDMRKSAEALLGFDEILRFFLLKEDSNLSNIDFEIPVRVSRGSWMIEIVDKIFSVEGITAIYVMKSAQKAATDGLFQIGIAKDIKVVFKASLKSIQWIIKIASHIGTLSSKAIKAEKLERENGEIFIKIPNDKNKYLKVSQKHYNLFKQCPDKLFKKSVSIVESGIALEVGVYENKKHEIVAISEKEKSIFCNIEEKEIVILPELKHGQNIELEGQITKVTEDRNSVGFRYKDHILICKPQLKQIAQYKNKIISREFSRFFLERVRIRGIVNRTDSNKGVEAKKPQILFSEIIPVNKIKDGAQLSF